MDQQLNTTTSNNGTQVTTQNPQAAGQPGITGAPAGAVQPVVPGDVLKSQIGVPIQDRPLTTVDLTNTQTGTSPAPVPKTSQFNPALMGVSVLLFAIAVYLFWITSRSGKKHNQYK